MFCSLLVFTCRKTAFVNFQRAVLSETLLGLCLHKELIYLNCRTREGGGGGVEGRFSFAPEEELGFNLNIFLRNARLNG